MSSSRVEQLAVVFAQLRRVEVGIYHMLTYAYCNIFYVRIAPVVSSFVSTHQYLYILHTIFPKMPNVARIFQFVLAKNRFVSKGFTAILHLLKTIHDMSFIQNAVNS